MANFEWPRNRISAFTAFAAELLVLSAWPPLAYAQQQTQGFAVERFYPSAPGGGWFVMDDVNISGGLGGAISLTTGYSRNPLVVTSSNGAQRLILVSNEAFVDVGVAVTYDRYRVYLNLPVPLLVAGNSGTVGPYQVTAPEYRPESRYHLRFSRRLRHAPARKAGEFVSFGRGCATHHPFRQSAGLRVGRQISRDVPASPRRRHRPLFVCGPARSAHPARRRIAPAR